MVKAKLLEAQTEVGHDEPGEKNGILTLFWIEMDS